MAKGKDANDTQTAPVADVTAIKAEIYDCIALMKQTQARVQSLENDLRIAQRQAITAQRPFNNRGNAND